MKSASWVLLLVCCAGAGCLAQSAGKSTPSSAAAAQPVTADQLTAANAHQMADALQKEMEPTSQEPVDKQAQPKN